MDFQYSKLVMSGGGVWGVAYGGAAKALAEHGIYDQIDGVAGTSAGAAAAMLVSLRYSPAELQAIVSKMPFARFLGSMRPFHVFSTYGLYSSKPLAEWLRQQVASAGRNFTPPRTMNGRETFQQLRQLSDIDLRVFATDLNTRSVTEFSARKTPEVAVVDGVRASMSIPMAYQTFRFPENNPNDHHFVDGGVMIDYPINAFDADGDPAATLGLHLGLIQPTLAVKPLGRFQLIRWVELLYGSFLRVQVETVLGHPNDRARTVPIQAADVVSSMDFHLTEDQIRQLESKGYEDTRAFLRKVAGHQADTG